jgi:hypothetical protein
MARTVHVQGLPIKLRRPWVCFLLALITFGLYYLYWYYASNRDLTEYGQRLDSPNPLAVSPALATLAVSVGWFLIIPPFISQWRFYRRICKAQELSHLDPKINHVLGFVLFLVALVLLPFEIPYAQTHLNALWGHEAGEGEKKALGLRG